MARDAGKRREYDRRYREKNREKLLEQKRAWREANPEKVREQNRRYREANRKKIRESNRRWWHKHRGSNSRAAEVVDGAPVDVQAADSVLADTSTVPG